MNRLTALLFCPFILIFGLSCQASAADSLTEAQNAYAAGNYAKAFELYTSIAKQGDAKAQLSLGTMYYIGQGVTQDYSSAAKWFQRSAKKGNVLAQDIMGEMYSQGLGVTQNYKEAAKWYRMAAEQGDATGQFNLGKMYIGELGLPKDFIQGYMWLSLSAKSPDELERAKTQMTEDQIDKANQLASQCAASKFKNC